MVTIVNTIVMLTSVNTFPMSKSISSATVGALVHAERAADAITGEHWRAAARAVELPADLAVDRAAELGERMPSAIDNVIAHPDGNKETRAIMTRLAEPIADHVERCLTRL